MASWQDKLTSSRSRLDHILSSGDMSDVTFVVGEPPEEKRFNLHKLIISMSSDVFFTMFYGSLPEMGEVKVPDIHPDIFEIMMKYVYEDSFSVETMEQAMYTYCASEKYNIPHLRDLCANYITDNLSPENLPIVYRIPAILENLQIKSECKTMLSVNTSDILTSDNFAKAPLDMVKDIVQLECLNVSTEENLFELVLKWAKLFCLQENPTYTTNALRAVMDHFLPHIRFLGMSTDSFLLGPVRSAILTDSEIASISKNILTPGCRELPRWCNKGMSRNTMRFFPFTDRHACSFTGHGYSSIKYSISMNRGSILFKGVSVYMPALSALFTTSLEIVLIDIFKCSYNTETKTKCSYDTEKSLLKCMLLEPFPLSFGKKYEISLSSDKSYIFGECRFVHSGNSLRRNQDFETDILKQQTDEYHLSFTRLGFAHFYEIFYTKI